MKSKNNKNLSDDTEAGSMDKTEAGSMPDWFQPELFPAVEDKLSLSEREWRKRLSETEYRILRTEGTEMPFENEYYDTETEGVYLCRSCSNPLFSSGEKYHSGTGWPSYYAPISQDRIGVKSDNRLMMERTEVHCARCQSHLGHVFEDGPAPTGLRYCLNSSTLQFIDKQAHHKIASGREEELPFRLNR